MHFQFLRTCKGILSRKPQPQVLNRRCMSIQIAFLQVVRLFSRLAMCDTTSSEVEESICYPLNTDYCYVASKAPQSRGLGGAMDVFLL